MILNDEQRAAIAIAEHVSLVSCPGSGKTRTIVAKILRCLENVRDTSRKIGCITYTNTAVNEIEHRLRLFGSRQDDLHYEIGTIHSYCLNHFIRPSHHLLPEFSSGFEVLTADDPRWQQEVSRLVSKYDIDRRRLEAFERIDRQPDGTIFTPPEVGEPAAREFVDFVDSNAFITFGEMVFHSMRLATAYPEISRGLASRFAWLLIDEFQDTTAAQIELFKSIAAYRRTKFFMVGDPNQSIMSFAGGRPGLLGEFSEFLKANQDVRLRGNYRCSERIVNHAELLCQCDPPMQAVGEHKDFPTEPEYVHVTTIAQAIFEQFIPAVESLGIPLGEAAVLAPWWVTLLGVSRELRLRGVPMIGPGARPYRRSRDFSQFAEHACAYIEQPDEVISRAAHRALFLLLLNVTGSAEWRVYSYDGKKTLFKLLRSAKQLGRSYDGAVDWLRAAAAEFSDVLVHDEFLPPSKQQVLLESANGMIDDMVRNNVDVENLLLNDLALYARPSQCLNLLTLHSSKGREFDAVAIIDLHDGRVPDFRAESPEQIDEARRLLYVGVTRARKLLMYCTDSSHRRNRPSRFLGPDGLNILG